MSWTYNVSCDIENVYYGDHATKAEAIAAAVRETTGCEDDSVIYVAQARPPRVDFGGVDLLDHLAVWVEEDFGSPAAAELIASLAAAKQAQSAAEIALRSWGEAEFLTTGNKKPAPGVGIRVSKKMVYEELAAIDWAKENAPALILPMLDRKPFEAMMATRPAPFVSTEEIVTVTIATNLE